VKLVNGTTPRFFLERGIRQGCPISPFLFLLVTQTLTLYIKNYNFYGIKILEREIKCCQLADDTTIFVRDSLEIKRVIDCLNSFSLVSGLKLNLNKCELFPLKNCELLDINGIPVKKVITYLGIKICKDEKERGQLNFQSVVKKVKNRFNLWLMRDLSLNGRILLSKTECLSRLLYPAISLEVPNNIIKEVDKNLFNFIWRNRSHYLKKDT